MDNLKKEYLVKFITSIIIITMIFILAHYFIKYNSNIIENISTGIKIIYPYKDIPKPLFLDR